MAYKTYHARLLVDGNTSYETEQPLTTTDQPYADNLYRSLLSVYNRAGSDAVVRIDSLRWAGHLRGAENTRHYLGRQSSTAYLLAPVISSPVTVTALSDSAATLNANVVVANNDGTFNGTATNLLPFFHYGQLPNSNLAGRSFGVIDGLRKSLVQNHSNASAQPYVIREGESFIFLLSNVVMASRCVVAFRHSGVVYEANFEPEKTSHTQNTSTVGLRFSIRNLTGSGSNVDILSVDAIDEMSNQDLLPVVSNVNLIDDQVEGSDITTTAHDTASGACPALIELKTGARTLRVGGKRGAWVSSPQITRHTTMTQFMYSDASWAGFLNVRHFKGEVLDKALVLREGEGVAVIPMLPAVRYTGEWNVTFSVDSGSGGGGNTYPRSRITNA